jgi:hypothetical protein
MITIANLEANYYMPQGMPDQILMKRRLDEVVARLPSIVSDHFHPSASDATAVYRIRHLQLDLWVDALGMTEGEIAHNEGRLLLHAITHAILYGGSGDVMRYDDHAHFLAAFLGDLLNGTAWSRWVYEEFDSLRSLSTGQVAAHLLVSRPGLLGPVAAHLRRGQQLERLLQKLGTKDVDLLWRHGLGFTSPDLNWLPPADLLETVLQTLRTGTALETTPGSWKRNLLRLYLSVIVAQPKLAGNTAVAGVVHHLVRLHLLSQKRPVAVLWSALGQQEIDSPDALDSFLAGLDAESAGVGIWLRTALATAAGRAYLAKLVPVAVPAAAKTSLRRMYTSFAGLAFLLPVFRDLGLYTRQDAALRYQVLLAALGKEKQPVAWNDLAVSWLAGLAPREQEQARTFSLDWPDLAQWGEAHEPTESASQATEHFGTFPGSALTLLVLRRFTVGVRGFEGSSPGYLAGQFLNLPGYYQVDDELIQVHLSRAPLGVVLRMSGRDGEQGRIPWLGNRMLVIHLSL